MAMRRTAILAVIVALAVYLAMREINAWRAAQPQPTLPEAPFVIDSARGSIRFNVELATTKPQQERGLMFRRSLGPDQGMLFDLHTERRVALWMKNTLIPLDMLFFDKDGVLVFIVHEAKPMSLKPLGPHRPVRAVLEVLGGRSNALGLEPGDLSEDAIFAHPQH
jgi:uncharacterized membrane protein (UPF0127 family)